MTDPEGMKRLEIWADGNQVLIVVPDLKQALELMKEMAEALEKLSHDPYGTGVKRVAHTALGKFREWK